MAEGKPAPDASGFRNWLYAFLFMLALSAMVLAIRFFFEPVFNPAFEVCIFYIPTAILLVIVLRVRAKRSDYNYEQIR